MKTSYEWLHCMLKIHHQATFVRTFLKLQASTSVFIWAFFSLLQLWEFAHDKMSYLHNFLLFWCHHARELHEHVFITKKADGIQIPQVYVTGIKYYNDFGKPLCWLGTEDSTHTMKIAWWWIEQLYLVYFTKRFHDAVCLFSKTCTSHHAKMC